MGKRLAVIFPGIGYHCDKPILYYSRKLAKEQEYKEIISLEYSYTEKNIRGNEKRMKEVFDVLYQQAEKLLETIDFSKYENVLFISKSVGTAISSAYAQTLKLLPIQHPFERFACPHSCIEPSLLEPKTLPIFDSLTSTETSWTWPIRLWFISKPVIEKEPPPELSKLQAPS